MPVERSVHPPSRDMCRGVPNQLGPECNAHALESILKYVAPELGWR